MSICRRLNLIRTASLAAAVVLVLCVAARADTESAKLAKHQAKVDAAVDRALKFLAEERVANHVGDGSFRGKHGKTNAVAGLVGMAFLSKGYTPRSGPYSHAIRKCVDYVLSTPAKNGYLGVRGGRMYGHGIATLFLSEVSGMVGPERQKRIDIVLPRALKVILDAQKVPKKKAMHNGGWRYEPTGDSSDISISGWCLLALRSARTNGCPVPASAINDAVAFIDRCVRADTGGFRYDPSPDWYYRRRRYWVRNASKPACTGVGILCRELTGHHADPINIKAADYLLKAIKGKFLPEGQIEYATYYCSQAMFQLGGKYWDEFAPAMYKYLLPRQKANGSWSSNANGDIYPTAMFVLALTVSHRQLPIYQR